MILSNDTLHPNPPLINEGREPLIPFSHLWEEG